MYLLEQVISDFEEKWAIGEVEGWENEGQENGHVSQSDVIDLDYYSTVEELMELGPEKLKEVSNLSFCCISLISCLLWQDWKLYNDFMSQQNVIFLMLRC